MDAVATPPVRASAPAACGVAVVPSRARAEPPRRHGLLRWSWVSSVLAHGGLVALGLLATSPSKSRAPVLEVCSGTATWTPDAPPDTPEAEPDAVVPEPPPVEADPIEVVEPPVAAEPPPPPEEAEEIPQDDWTAVVPTGSTRLTENPPMDAVVARRRPVAIATPPPAAAPQPPTATPTPPSAPARSSRGQAVARARPYATNRPPAYPPEAVRLGIRGVVSLLLEIDEAGVVRVVTVATSSGSGVLDDAAVAAAREWRFEPASADDGSPVATRVLQRVGFAPPS